jgi:DNA-directed RNA polymerase subunit K/omega
MARKSSKLQAKYLVEADGPDVNESLQPQTLLTEGRQKYLLINVLARRARELNKGGARPLVVWEEGRTPSQVAYTEASEGKLKLVRKSATKSVLVSMIKNE